MTNLHSLDLGCNHTNLIEIGSTHNLMGFYHYDAFCKDCNSMVYASKGRPIWSYSIITVPWTINQNLGWISDIDQKGYEKIMVLKNTLKHINDCDLKCKPKKIKYKVEVRLVRVDE